MLYSTSSSEPIEAEPEPKPHLVSAPAPLNDAAPYGSECKVCTVVYIPCVLLVKSSRKNLPGLHSYIFYKKNMPACNGIFLSMSQVS
jgi:hypothetical protein